MKTVACTILIGLMTLTACGGSDSDGTSPPVISPPDTTLLPRCITNNVPLVESKTTSTLSFFVEPEYIVGQQSSIVGKVEQQDSLNLQFSWKQVAGSPIELIAPNSPVLALQLPSDGDYTFTLNIIGDGIALNEEITVTASSTSSPILNARIDHQVVEGNEVSIRVDQNNNQTASSLSWCIASGPDLSVDLSNLDRPLFTAPKVSADTLIQLNATAEINGVAVSDQVVILTTNEKAITSSYFDKPVARTYAYLPNSDKANVLANCVYSNQLVSPCTISTLPLIGQSQNTTDKTAILERVLVSHPWMGKNFDAFLSTLDPNSDFATLLQSVTAIVISYDVRPSFYWVATGAIYLDPEDLWLSESERDTINEAPDYRSNYGEELQFLMPWRYVKDNQYASYYIPRTQRTSRSLASLAPDLASLLYHELAHANDFFPRSTHSSLQGPRLIDDYNRFNSSKSLVSDRLSSMYPLTNSEMAALAAVRFKGDAASSTQKSYQPSDVSTFFKSDVANDFYNYSTIREDTAMLFEEAMMSHRYGILRDVGVTDKPITITASSITVDWGQRGRIAQDSLLTRAAFAIDEIMPELNGTEIISSLPEPIAMVAGKSWLENLTISPVKQQKSATLLPPSIALDSPPVRLSGER